jgi:MFS family permease
MLIEPRTDALRRGVARRVPVPVAIVAGSLVLAALSLLLPSAPTYDPWAWIVWGREITQLDLDTVDGPSWKPLPVLFTTVFALAGDAAPDLWLVVARAGAIAGVPLAFLLAHRLAGPVAGAAAAAGLALAPWSVRNGALGNSEGLLIALLFATILAHVDRRRGWAFVLALAVGMLRPEAWPFVGLYALWLLYDERRRLPWVAAGLFSLPVLWLGPELWGSGNALRASDRAQQPNPDSPAFADNPALEVVDNAIGMIPWAAVAGVVALLVLVAARRAPQGRGALAAGLAGVAAAWIVLVALMTSNGFSGNSRYLMPPAALLIVLGAAGLVWAAGAAWRRRAPGTALLAVAAVAAMVAFAGQDAHDVPDQLRGVEYQAELADGLGRVVEKAGGADRLRGCGHAYTNPFLVPQVAWHLDVHAQQVDLDPDQQRPAVVFHVKHVRSARGRAPAWAKRGRTELAREGTWIVTADCQPGETR